MYLDFLIQLLQPWAGKCYFYQPHLTEEETEAARNRKELLQCVLRAGTPVTQTPESAWQWSEPLGEERPGLSRVAHDGAWVAHSTGAEQERGESGGPEDSVWPAGKTLSHVASRERLVTLTRGPQAGFSAAARLATWLHNSVLQGAVPGAAECSVAAMAPTRQPKIFPDIDTCLLGKQGLLAENAGFEGGGGRRHWSK